MIRLKWEVALVMALAVALALAVFGLRIANPYDLSWIYGDTITGQFGWEQYQADRDNWFPIETNRYSWPLPMPLAMFDNMPLVALFIKAVVPASSGPIQYFGPVFLIGIALQALFAWLLLRELTPDRSGAAYRMAHALGALFLATSPTLLVRFQYSHMALTQHWLLLAGLLLMARSGRAGAERTLFHFALLQFVAAAINIYMMVMTTMILAGVVLKLLMGRQIARKHLVLLPLPVATALLAMLISGFFSFGGGKLHSGDGYQFFSANLFTFFNPMAEQFGSLFLPDITMATNGQYEGFAYLGLGAIALMAGGLVFTRIKNDGGEGTFAPLMVVVVGAFVIALSTHLTFGPYSSVLPVPEQIVNMLGIFRSSGRFVWVPLYALLAIAIAGLIRNLPDRRAAMLLALAALVQIADTAPPFAKMHDRFARSTKPPRFSEAAYTRMAPAHDTILVLPAWQCQIWAPGKYEYSWAHFMKFSRLAMDNKMVINSFYGGRTPDVQMTFHCETMPKRVLSKPAVPRTVYLVSQRSFTRFVPHISASHYCDFADEMFVCRGDRGKTGLSDRAKTVEAAILAENQHAAPATEGPRF